MESARTQRAVRGLCIVTLGAGLLAARAQDSGSVPPVERRVDVVRDARVLIGSVDFTTSEVDMILGLSPLPPPPPDPTNRYYEDPAAAHFGRALFFEKGLSSNGAVSCATCHEPDKSWTDGLAVGEGVGQQNRNAMSLWNVAYNRWFFWDGRRDTLWAQALTPLESPVEHGVSRLEVVRFIADRADYRRGYEAIFGPLPDLSDSTRFPAAGRPVDDDRKHPHDLAWRSMRLADRDVINRAYSNLGKSIAAFERQIVSGNSAFDRYVEGLREKNPIKQRAITSSAKRGLQLFIGKGRCFLCHTGPNFTDKEFHNDRVLEKNSELQRSPGRFEGIELVQRDAFNGVGHYSDDRGGEAEAKLNYLIRDGHSISEFKTPSLRNVALSAPYMRQGQFATLEDVVAHYSRFANALPSDRGGERILQPLHLDEEESADLIEFLHALTDTGLPRHLESAPETPHLTE